MHIHVVGEIPRVSPFNNELNVLSPRLGYHMSRGMVALQLSAMTDQSDCRSAVSESRTEESCQHSNIKQYMYAFQ